VRSPFPLPDEKRVLSIFPYAIKHPIPKQTAEGIVNVVKYAQFGKVRGTPGFSPIPSLVENITPGPDRGMTKWVESRAP
jgi:hypothetical protein